MTNILVTGGAGYIGSHTCLDLAAKGFTPVAFDSFSRGHREFVRWGPSEEGDIRDAARLDDVFRTYRPEAVVHLAALIEVGESDKDPLAFYDNNVAGTISLLQAMRRAGCGRIVFSSTCATYGDPVRVPMTESHPQAPLNPYGQSKLMVEKVMFDLAERSQLDVVALRYFNAAGADEEGRIGEWHEPETHAIPLAIEAALGRRAGFKVFGTDYETRDGTCVRDFIHVADLADAHSRAVQYLLDGGKSTALNLGTGTGTSVRELLSAIEARAGRSFPVEETGRRAGDAPVLVIAVADRRHRLAVAFLIGRPAVVRRQADRGRSRMTNLARSTGLPLLLLSAVLASAVAPSGAEEMDGASFLDEFEALDDGRWYISDGWTNGDHQNCGWSRKEIGVDGGRLLVGFSQNPAAGRAFRCGEIQTRARFGHGTYEARIRTPAGSGLNANIFTYIGEVHGAPHDEIDFEFLLRDTSKVQLNIYRDGDGGNATLVDLPSASDAAFRDYAFVWEPGRVTWYIDGVEVHRIEDVDVVPVNHGKIYLSLWGTDTLTEWMGPFEPPAGPLAMEVERVAFTRLAEPCQFPESVACGVARSQD